MDATAIVTGLAKDTANPIIAAVIKQIKDVVELEENLELLNTDFNRMEGCLRYIDKQFQEQQRRLLEPVELCLTRMNHALTQAKELVESAKRHRRRCFRCCLLCNPKLTTGVRNWETKFAQFFQDLQNDFSITANTQHIASTSAPQAEVLLQDVPDDIVGSTIYSAQMKLQTWFTEPAHCVIGIHGMGGIGKTSVLKVIHNHYKEKVSGVFDVVIWSTISQYKNEGEDDKIKELQISIAQTLNLDLNHSHTPDMRKMKLSAYLEKKRFLIILDDMWRFIDLNKIGVKFGHDKGSKVLISSRSSDVIRSMGANDYSFKMQPLSEKDGWELFRRKAFTNGAAPEKDIETIAEEIAKECQGLPLALNVVAAALSSERDVSKWRDALAFMTNVDPSFPETHTTIDTELYQRLRWSYNDLSDDLKSCFLYCAAFPEDTEIDAETLLEMWSAEGLVKRRGITNLKDVGHHYIDFLASRCLIEYVGLKKMKIPCKDNGGVIVNREVIKVHDVLRDMAIYIGERDEQWVFASAQHLHNFPVEEVNRNCKRLSVGHNDIQHLPTDLECTGLVSLVLAHNTELSEVPAASLLNMMSLKVLDLSCCTLITSLPTSVGQLGELEFLNLQGCYRLKELPESICTLSRLQFLNLDFCESLISLPDKIGELKSLKHFSFHTANRNTHMVILRGILGPDKIGELKSRKRFSFHTANRNRHMVIPRGIFGLTSFTKLCLPLWRRGCAISMEDIRNLSNMLELSIAVKADTMGNNDCTWSEMRKLTLRYYHADDKDDVVEDAQMSFDILPSNMENMIKLQSLCLIDYRGVSLPNYISKFQNLETLALWDCGQLRELPLLEIGSDSARDSFPMLKRLVLKSLDKLESITGVLTMSKLQYVEIWNCPSVKRLPMGMEHLYNLQKIKGQRKWWSKLIWEADVTKVKLEGLFEVKKDY